MNPISKLALIPLLIFAAACGEPAEGAGAPAELVTPVQLADVVPQGRAPVITATGTLGAKDEISLSFKIGGIVARVLVDAGARVRRGAVLAVLDQREIDAMLAKATAGADKARRDAERAERLFKDSVVTLAQMQDAQTGRAAAEADLRAARVNHEYATIVAPAHGVVLSRSANPGQLVGPGAPVIQFASSARGSVLRAGIPDRSAVLIRQGTEAQVSFDALPGKVFTGRVSQVGASADPRTGLYVVEVSLDNVSGLPSGLVGRLTIGCATTDATKGTDTKGRPGTSRCGDDRAPRDTDARGTDARGTDARATDARGTDDRATDADGVSAIPAESLVEGDGAHGLVFTVDATGTRARRVAVTLVGLAGDKVLVRGLGGVTRVVSAGASWLSDSARVEIKP